MNNEALKAEYVELLKTIDTSYLDVRNKRIGGPKGLSGLFLASVAEGYSQAKNKVMIVGSETAGWEPLAKYDDFQSIDSYVGTTMQKHLLFFEKKLKQKSNDRGHTFHNFTRAAAKVVGEDGLIYTNLFCFDWRGKSPIKSPQFDFIKDLSGKILDAQIKVLQPEYIIFANGISSAKYRRDFFPVGDGARCTNPKSYPEIVSSHYLWEFMLDTRIKCFRVHHPSARSKYARIGRVNVLELLANTISDRSLQYS
ncbi:MAG: hypothetical protein RIQ94_2006 [Pseudomonadota bacterium]|jgi:hypothetical protein